MQSEYAIQLISVRSKPKPAASEEMWGGTVTRRDYIHIVLWVVNPKEQVKL